MNHPLSSTHTHTQCMIIPLLSSWAFKHTQTHTAALPKVPMHARILDARACSKVSGAGQQISNRKQIHFLSYPSPPCNFPFNSTKAQICPWERERERERELDSKLAGGQGQQKVATRPHVQLLFIQSSIMITHPETIAHTHTSRLASRAVCVSAHRGPTFARQTETQKMSPPSFFPTLSFVQLLI